MNLGNMMKLMNIQNILLEATGWDEERASYLNEALLYGLKSAPKEFRSNIANEETISLIIAIIEPMVDQNEIPACKEALTLFFKKDDEE